MFRFALCLIGLLVAVNVKAQSLVFHKRGGWGGAPINTFEVDGNDAYAAVDGGLSVLDISNAADPKPVGHLFVGKAESIHLFSHMAVLAGNNTYHVVDISNPIQPKLMTRFNLEFGSFIRVARHQQFLYVLSLREIYKVDLSDLDHPQLEKLSIRSHLTYYVDVQQGHLLTADSSFLNVYELDDAGQPTLVQQMPLENFGLINSQGVYEDGYLYLLSEGLHVINLTDITQPYTAFYGDDIPWHGNFSISGNLLVSTSFVGDIYLTDVSDKQNPVVLNAIEWEPGLRHPKIRNHQVFIANYYSGMTVFDVQNPLEPVRIHQDTAEIWEPGAVAVKDQIAYVQTLRDVRIFDLSDPDHPQLLTRLDQPAKDLMIKEDLLFVVSDELIIYDLTQPQNPIEISRFIPFTPLKKGSIQGDRLALRALWEVYVIDVSDPLNPTLTSRVFQDEGLLEPVELLFDGEIVITRFAQGFSIHDVSPPVFPELKGVYTYNRQDGVALRDHTLFVSADGQTTVYTIAEDFELTAINHLDQTYTHLTYQDGFLLGGAQDGLAYLDVQDPQHITLVDQLAFDGGAAMTARDGMRVAATNAVTGRLELADLRPSCRSPRFLSALPDWPRDSVLYLIDVLETHCP